MHQAYPSCRPSGEPVWGGSGPLGDEAFRRSGTDRRAPCVVECHLGLGYDGVASRVVSPRQVTRAGKSEVSPGDHPMTMDAGRRPGTRSPSGTADDRES